MDTFNDSDFNRGVTAARGHKVKLGINLAKIFQLVESPKGSSPSGSHRSALETLASYGSSYPLQLPSLHKLLAPPICGWLKSILDMSAPSLHFHYRNFSTTTS